MLWFLVFQAVCEEGVCSPSRRRGMKTFSFGGVLLYQFIVVIRHSHTWVFLGTLYTRKQAQGHRHRYCHLPAIRRSKLTRDPDIFHCFSDGFSSYIKIMFDEFTHLTRAMFLTRTSILKIDSFVAVLGSPPKAIGSLLLNPLFLGKQVCCNHESARLVPSWPRCDSCGSWVVCVHLSQRRKTFKFELNLDSVDD